MQQRPPENYSRVFKKPTAADYLSRPRSKMLRETCIIIIESLVQVLHNPEANIGFLLTIVHINAQQLSLEGISPTLHVGLTIDRFEDPVIAAEYIAGQLMNLLNRSNIIVSKDIRDQLAVTFVNGSSDGILIKDVDQKSDSLIDSCVSADSLRILASMLDADNDGALIKGTNPNASN